MNIGAKKTEQNRGDYKECFTKRRTEIKSKISINQKKKE